MLLRSSSLRALLAERHRDHLIDLGRRSRQVLLLAGVTGLTTGLVVAAFEMVTGEGLLPAVLGLPLWLQALAPAIGLLVSALCLRASGERLSPSTSDEYIRAFHDSRGTLSFRPVPYRLAAAVATLGSGVPLGYEGPALYTGAGIGSALQRRLSRFLSGDDIRVLMVAGAAAGVAAIFKAPVTGLVFALEVPYQEDLARRMLLPATIASATSYVAFAALAGTEPILPVAGQPPFNLVDLGGAALVGLFAGVLARLFTTIVKAAKRMAVKPHPFVGALAAGVVLAGTVFAAAGLDEESLVLGPGYRALEWALEPERTLLAIVALGTLRVIGTTAAVAGGGTGGLFIPLVIQGALVGRVVGDVLDVRGTLFPVVGMAAFLGAGYRVPLAAVVFVAEFTGRPGFVVPGLIAAAVAQLVMGNVSISPYQMAGRVGHIENRLRLPLRTVVNTEVRTAPSDATVEEVFWQHLVGARAQSVAVVDGDRYLGMARAEDFAAIDRDMWAETVVGDVMRTDLPVADVDWLLSDAVAALDQSSADRIAVCAAGSFIGVISASDLIELDEVLDQADRASGGPGRKTAGADPVGPHRSTFGDAADRGSDPR